MSSESSWDTSPSYSCSLVGSKSRSETCSLCLGGGDFALLQSIKFTKPSLVAYQAFRGIFCLCISS
jgi:hypothetical protein